MRRALERALDHAERGTESARQRPPKRKSSSAEEKALHEKLYDMYVEAYGKEPEGTEELTHNVNLLEKLVRREALPHLVASLYPGEQYSLVLKAETKVYTEFVIVPYEERDFLDYLDVEQLSPDLVDVLERSRVNIFQSGCVITEVRDYRQCTKADRSRYQSRHVLLRPAMQTLASDVHAITSNNQTWAQEGRLSLESQPVLATAEPLCPGPSVSVACSENKLLYNNQTPPMRRTLQEDYSAASLYPQQELPCSSPPPELRAWAPDQQSQADQQDDLEIFKENCVDMWEQVALDLEVPFDSDTEKFAEDWPFQYDNDGDDDDAPNSIVWPDSEADDSLFGCEGNNPSQTTKRPIMQSLNDPFISGERSPEKVRCGRQTPHPYCYTEDHSYCVMPGSKRGAGKETGESQKLVKRDKCAVREAQASSGSASLIQLSPGRAEKPWAVTIQSAVQDQGSQHTLPVIHISCSSGNSSLGKPFISQQASCIRIRQLPSPAPALEPPGLAQIPAVEVKRVRTLPTATVTSASTTQATPVIQVKASTDYSKVVQLTGPVRIVRTVVRRSNPIQGSPRRARAPSGVKPSSRPSRGQAKNAGPAAPQAPCPGGVQYVLGNLSSLRPVRVFWVPHGSDISAIQQQAQQQQQVLYPLIPQPLQQQPPTAHLPQPVVQVSSVQGGSGQQRGPSAPQAAVIKISGVGSVLQSQRVELSQPGQRPSQVRVQLPAAFQKLPQSQWRIVHLPEAVATASVQPAQPGGGQQTAGQAKGPENGGLPSTPKC